MKAYVIGGSPCSGKSTVASYIAEHYDLFYFKVDDKLEEYTKFGAERGYKMCSKIRGMTAEETWMRPPELQASEELAFYREIFPFVLQDMKKISVPLIAEGATFLPELVKDLALEAYVCITPSKQFQIEHYRQREWVKYVLQDCSNPKKAFENWMERDALFAEHVRRKCDELGVFSFVTDGTQTIEEQIEKVIRIFQFQS